MDAIYQCYKKNQHVEFVLENFYKNGGDIVYLLSDADNDFSYLKEKYKDKLIYKYNTEKTWCGKTIGWNSKSQALHWMIWYTEACRQLNSDYILLLEDDVYIRGNINDIKISGEIMGPPEHKWNKLNESVQKYLNSFDNKNISTSFYVGCGGSIMNRQIISNGEFVYLMNKHYETLISLCEKLLFSDAMLTSLFRLCGYKSVANNDYTEPWLNPNWKNTKEKIVHQCEFTDIL